MIRATEIRRVIVVVLDGLRPDAIDAFDLTHARRLAQTGASTMSAATVTPSVTWAAMTSLMTGVSPDVHGVVKDSLHIPRPRAKLLPLPDVLLGGGYPSSAFLGDVPALYRGVASGIAKRLGFTEARFVGASATETLLGARSTLRTQKRGLILFHWGDADRVGHEHGWMSPQYGEAARRLDAALGLLVSTADIERDPHTLLIAFADHGGGGVKKNDHDDVHPVNATIPIMFGGGSVVRRSLGAMSLLDVPSTVTWALGVKTPESYAGRAVTELFEPDVTGAVA
jgi:arylsulfatase A-like enzyme